MSLLLITFLGTDAFLGHDHAKVNVNNNGVEVDKHLDPWADYIRMRYISTCEAAWRIFGFGISQQNPPVARLSVHEEGANRPQYRLGFSQAASKASSLIRYLNRPLDPLFDDMLYACYSTEFIVAAKPPQNEAIQVWNEAHVLPNVPPCYVTRRARGEKIARIKPVRPGFGEVFYIRMLLRYHAARSFNELKTINGVCYETHQQATRAAGLLEEQNEGRLAMEDAIMEYKSAAQLRFLFVMLILEGSPAMDLWDRFKDNMALDYANNRFDEQTEWVHTQARERALEDIERLLGERQFTNADFGLPRVTLKSAEIRADLEYFAPQAAQLAQFATDTIEKMSEEQRDIYNIIDKDIYDPDGHLRPRLHFLTGKAGRGKSFIVKAIIAKARSLGRITVVSGSTALSVSDVDGGRTAHSTFRIPVTDDNTGIECNVTMGSPRADYLREAAFIVWDELPMSHVAGWEAVDIKLRELTEVDEPFGGKVVIAIGDFRQVAPVVKGGGPTAHRLASVLSSALWPHFQVHQLIAPQRNKTDPEFADAIDAIGEDTTGARVNLRRYLLHTPDFDFVQQALYPEAILADPIKCVKRAFLTPLNVDVDRFNAHMLDKLPGPVCKFVSAFVLITL